MSEPLPSSAQSAFPGWRRWVRPLLVILAVALLNVLAYLILTPERIELLGTLGYASAFTVAGIANATVVIPVPYYPIIARLGQVFDVWGVVLAAAAGSALGESVAFFVGRAGQGTARKTRFYIWVQDQLHHPWRAALVLFLLAAPPNPAFDVAGLLAGALGLPLWLFLGSVFLGRLIRMGMVVLVGLGIG